jgi:3-dehydroquinate dehydratase II
MKVLVLNGPNLASLGRREPMIYGKGTLADLSDAVSDRAKALGCDVIFFQSNHEGALIDEIEKERDADAVIVNPGALGHTSYALYDALRGFAKPVIEVHISQVFAREEFRHRSVTAAAAHAVISGLGFSGYLLALDYLAKMLKN